MFVDGGCTSPRRTSAATRAAAPATWRAPAAGGEPRPTGRAETAAAAAAGVARAVPGRPRRSRSPGGTLLTVGPQGTIEKGTVLIHGGKITAVGPDVAVPPGAT